jgi:prevent-host-death family protein
MTVTVGAFEAKTKLAELLDRVEQGEEVVITRRGKEVARLIAWRSSAPSAPAEKEAKIRAIMKRSAALIKKHGITATSQDHDELLYDELGLPK